MAPTEDPDALIAAVNRALLHGTAESHTLRVMYEQIRAADSAVEARALAVGLALGSPEFQRQ